MAKSTQERAALLRQAAIDGRRDQTDLFGMRMAIHDAFESTGTDSSQVCTLLISSRPPISDWDCRRLEMVASLIEAEPEARTEHLFRLCEMVAMIAPF